MWSMQYIQGKYGHVTYKMSPSEDLLSIEIRDIRKISIHKNEGN